MRLPIAHAVASAAARALRGVGSANALVAVTRADPPGEKTNPRAGPARDAQLIKIEININR